ncbi:hypothetical protein NMY22_g4831 [Coprinellus aureogranulatus]|nr:hypothetical protein NMY22_g4831 [Coprinellus aureogranulatus]
MIFKLSSFVLAASAMASASPVIVGRGAAACTLVVVPSGVPDTSSTPLSTEWNYIIGRNFAEHVPPSDDGWSHVNPGQSVVTGPNSDGAYTVAETISADTVTDAEATAIITGWVGTTFAGPWSGVNWCESVTPLTQFLPPSPDCPNGRSILAGAKPNRASIFVNVTGAKAHTITLTSPSQMMDYFETLEDEVHFIWSERFRIGSLLFATSRYTTILRLPFEILRRNKHTHFSAWLTILTLGKLSMVSDGCLSIGGDVRSLIRHCLRMISTITTTFSLVLCAHALLGAKKRYLAGILFIMSGFIIAAVGTSGRYMAAARWTVSDVPWISPCRFDSEEYLIAVNAYLAVSRESLLAILMAGTIYVRYRNQTNSLINIMRRDVGFYFSVLVVLGILHAVFRTPDSPVEDRYNIITALRMVLYPVLANRILLNIRNSKDRGVRTNAVSTLLFAPTDSETETDESTGIRTG